VRIWWRRFDALVASRLVASRESRVRIWWKGDCLDSLLVASRSVESRGSRVENVVKEIL